MANSKKNKTPDAESLSSNDNSKQEKSEKAKDSKEKGKKKGSEGPYTSVPKLQRYMTHIINGAENNIPFIMDYMNFRGIKCADSSSGVSCKRFPEMYDFRLVRPVEAQYDEDLEFDYSVDKSKDYRIMEIYKDRKVPGGKLARHVSPRYVASKLAAYFSETQDFGPGASIDLSLYQLEESVRLWQGMTEHYEAYLPRIIKDPPIVCFKSQLETAKRRVYFDPIVPDELPADPVEWLRDKAPYLHDTLSRMSNVKAFLQFIGSLFDPMADRKKAFWLWGDSGAGKSVLTKVFEKMFPGGIEMLSDATMRSKHHMTGFIDKLIAIYDEAHPDFPKMREFLAWTGLSEIKVDPKGKDAYLAKIFLRFIFTSNSKPNIPDKPEYTSRLALCHFKGSPKHKLTSEEFSKAIEPEIAFLVGLGMKCYYANDRKIDDDKTDLLEAIDSSHARYRDQLDKHFVAVKEFDRNDQATWMRREDFANTLYQMVPPVPHHEVEKWESMLMEYHPQITTGRFTVAWEGENKQLRVFTHVRKKTAREKTS